jgi:glycosyltransferase involved in cell wall biosynthesis
MSARALRLEIPSTPRCRIAGGEPINAGEKVEVESHVLTQLAGWFRGRASRRRRQPIDGARTPARAGIVFLVGQLDAGGLERQLSLLVPQLAPYAPMVFVWNYSEGARYVADLAAAGVSIRGCGPGYSSVGKLVRFCRVVRAVRPEVVHSYSFYTNFAAHIATRLTPAIAVGSIRSNFVQERRSAGVLLGRLSGRWPRLQIANSHAAAGNAERAGGWFRPARIWVVRNGMDLDAFPYRSEFPIETAVISVGSLLPKKRWDRLLNVAARVVGERHRCRFRLVGKGPLRDSLAAKAASLRLSDYFEFLGERKDIAGLLADSSFLVHTSEREGCPNVVLEAMASGRAVVAMDVGDLVGLVDDGINGFVVPQGDEDALTERVRLLIERPDLCRSMGREARAKAEREFTVERLVSETVASYRAAGWCGKS